MAGRREVGAARGVLAQGSGPASDAVREHVRRAPGPALAPYLAHYWWVAWDTPTPVIAETLPHPTAHIVYEGPGGAAELSGVSLKRFVRALSGRGRVFGLKLRPAVLGALVGPERARFDRPRPLAGALSSPALEAALLALGHAVATARSADDAVTAAERLLGGAAWPALSEAVANTRDLVERIERDRSLVRVSELADYAGLDVRTLERRFRSYVGLSPKAVIGRYRLIEAAERVQRDEHVSLAAIASELGYADQAHFTRDFRALVGRTPRALRAAARGGGR